jgi:dTDP-4-dehydrorhamnose reductase
MRILLAGFTGYVGGMIKSHLGINHSVTGVSSRCLTDATNFQCDLSDREAVFRLADHTHPEVIIHAAGNKNIDFCEKNPEKAFRINSDSVRNLAEAFATRCTHIYLSTDYVFDGHRGGYAEYDSPCPETAYGKSKLCGERIGAQITDRNFIILRLSAVYDLHATFPRYLMDKFTSNEPVECYSDVIYSPTYYQDFLRILDVILDGRKHHDKIFHASGEATTRYDFALIFAEVFGFNTRLVKKASGAGRGTVLFPDLSLLNERTRRILQVKRFGIADALESLKSEERNENYCAI